MNPKVDQYILNGCGRCPLGGTPDCKVHRWTQELGLLRSILQDSALTEELKWGAPCYTFQAKNVLMLSALKNYCCISFFKGSLLKDKKALLVKPGENSQAARLFKFTAVEAIEAQADDLKKYIAEAIEIEKAGLTVEFKKKPEPLLRELQERLEEDSLLRNAFEALTPGRQRGYILYFSQAKQSKTIQSRIEKCAPKILRGEGMHDHYKSTKR